LSDTDPDSDRSREPGLLYAVVRYSGLGLEMGAAVAIGAWLGWWLDGHYGTAPWGILGGVLLGGAAAGRLVWRSVRALNRGGAERDESE